jgi:AcrR family transcriptional regulator
MVAMSTAVDEPRRGRPRSAATDAAILAAAVELVGQVGIAGMSMDVLAERARVSKATIYRRWPAKEQLVIDALRSAISPVDDVDTGNLVGDLRIYLTELSRRMSNDGMRDVLPHLIEVACHDASVRASLDDYVQTRRRPLRAILVRGVERRQLHPDVDLDVLMDVLIGPFMHRRLLTLGPLDSSFIEQVLGLVVHGVVVAAEAGDGV